MLGLSPGKGCKHIEFKVGAVSKHVDFQGLRVLVVDDNTHMRRILRAILHGLGIREVFEAEDGAAALERFQSVVPDIVVTDWVMPIIDGLELTRMLRDQRSSANPFIPIIMVTGYAEKHRVIEARDAGVTEFMVKPVSAKALYDRLVLVVVAPRPFIKTKSYFGPDRRRFQHPNYQGADRRKDKAPSKTVRTG